MTQARHRASFPVMGTTASIHVNDNVSDGAFNDAVEELQVELERLEQMFSVYRPDSSVSRINTGELNLLDAPKEVLDVMDACTWMEQVSEGAFNVRPPYAPESINPSGFVKGWATERASRLFSDRGLRHWYVGVGGDFVLRGGLDDGTPWNIGITDPRDSEMLVGTVTVVDGAVATSGTAERGAHIWHPTKGQVDAEFLSVTVTGPSLTWADAFATTIFVMGAQGLEWLKQFEGYDALVVHTI